MSDMPTPPGSDPHQPPTPPHSATPPPSTPHQPSTPHHNVAPGAAGTSAAPLDKDSERIIAVLTHLAAPAAMLFSAGLLTFLGPLIVWFVFKDRSPLVRQSSAGAFNFAIVATVLGWLGWLLTVTIVFAIFGIPLLIVVVVLHFVVSVVGALRANKGEFYSYPMQWFKVLT